MSTARKILSSTAIQIIGKVMIGMLSVVTIQYVTSLESLPGLSGVPSDYKLIYTYLSFFGIVADFGLYTIAVREISQAVSADEQRFIMGNIFGMRFFTILLAMVLASLFVFVIPFENYTWQVKVGVSLAAITTILTMMASTVSSILQVHLKMIQPTIALVVGKIIMTAYIVGVILFFPSLPMLFYHLLFAGILGTLVTYGMTAWTTKRFFPFSFRFHAPYWKKIFKEALPYGIAIILGTIYFKIDELMISFFREKNEIAIYGYPSGVVELLTVFPVFFMNNVLPSLSQAFRESVEKAKKIASLAFSFLAFMTFPMVAGGIVLARPLMNFVMGHAFLTGNVPGYYGADLAFQLALFPTLFAFLNILFTFVLIASGNQKKILRINLVGVIFNVLTNLVFIPHYGFIAAGITTIFSEIIVLVLTYLECRKTIHIPLDYKTLLKFAIAATAMGAFIWYGQSTISVIPLVGIGALVYLLVLLLLKVLPDEAFQLLRKEG